MARHVWSVLCKYAVVSETNNVSMIDAFDRLMLPAEEMPRLEEAASGDQKVLIPLGFVVVSRWTRSDPDEPEEEAEVQILLKAPNGKTIVGSDKVFQIRLSGEARNFQPRLNYPTMPYMGLGRYCCLVRERSRPNARWRTVAKLGLELVSS